MRKLAYMFLVGMSDFRVGPFRVSRDVACAWALYRRQLPCQREIEFSGSCHNQNEKLESLEQGGKNQARPLPVDAEGDWKLLTLCKLARLQRSVTAVFTYPPYWRMRDDRARRPMTVQN